MSYRERIDLGADAEALKGNAALAKALDILEQGVTERRKALPANRTDLIGVVHQQELVLDAFRSALEGLIHDGQIARKQWADLQAKREGRVQRFLRRA